MKYIVKIKIIDIIIVSVFIILSAIGFYVYGKMNVGIIDFNGNRILCGYILNGINPLKHIGEPALIDYLGVVPRAYGNLPYGMLLGNLFYFGFLEYDYALFAYKVLSFICMVATLLIAKKYYFKFAFGNKLYFYFILFTIFSIHIACSYRVGNIGHIVCMLIAMAIFLCDDNTVASGIALSLAMIKPQITFPFCITFLFLKKFSIVFVAALIDILASVVCAIMVNENVFNLFLDFLNANVGGNSTTYGLLTILYQENYYSALFPSMLIGLIVLFFSHLCTKTIKNKLVHFLFPALVASFWSYSWSSDYYILVIPAIAFLYLFFIIDANYKKRIAIKLLLIINCFICLFLVAIKNFLRGYNFLSLVFKKLYQGKSYGERVLVGNTISYCILIVMIIFSILVVKNLLINNDKK